MTKPTTKPPLNELSNTNTMYGITDLGYSRVQLVSYHNRGSRANLTLEDVEKIREFLNNELDQYYARFKLYEQPPPETSTTAQTPYNMKYTGIGQGTNNRKANQDDVLSDLMDGLKYKYISQKHNISHQRVAQIAKKNGLSRRKKK